MAGKTGNERSQTIAMIAEVLWNNDGAPAMNDEWFEEKYVAMATDQYREFEAGTLEPWWQE